MGGEASFPRVVRCDDDGGFVPGASDQSLDDAQAPFIEGGSGLIQEKEGRLMLLSESEAKARALAGRERSGGARFVEADGDQEFFSARRDAAHRCGPREVLASSEVRVESPVKARVADSLGPLEAA